MAPILGIWASSKSTVASDTGAMFPIQNIVLSAGGTSSITFNNIPQTYTHLQIRGIGRSSSNYSPYDIDNILIKFNGDAVSNSNYTTHRLSGSGSSASAGGSGSTANNHIGMIPFSNALANVYAPHIIDILDYTSTNKYKTCRSLCGLDFNGTQSGAGQQGSVAMYSSLWFGSTNAITSITLVPGTYQTWAQYSSWALYGIKGA